MRKLFFKHYLGATTNSFQGSTKVALSDKVKSIDVEPEVGICYSDENEMPTYADYRYKLGRSIKDYSFTIKNEIEPGTTYYYRTYVKLLDEVYYSAVNFITTMGEKPIYTIINGHKFVDLGLPSGLLWAKTNIGASSSVDNGDYFAWGEVETKSSYSWETYRWGSDFFSFFKYNSTDGKTTLDAEDDAATFQWGKGCRMPSREEFQELYYKCGWYWMSSYNETGVSGYLVKGPNGNAIFFPASGGRESDYLCEPGWYGDYWSSTLESSSYPDGACVLYFTSGLLYSDSGAIRYQGHPVRPVAKK